jgi:hypothetical protein
MSLWNVVSFFLFSIFFQEYAEKFPDVIFAKVDVDDNGVRLLSEYHDASHT